ncbi:MAG: VOC family protein [Thermoplasmatota archaeon]
MTSTSSVFLNVQSIDKSVEFYKALGFRVTNETRDDDTRALLYADLVLDGAELGLGHIASNDDPAFRAWVATPLGAGVVIYFNVPNADAVLARAEKIRATIENPIKDRSYGRAFTLNDPDGYTVTFLTEKKRGGAKPATASRARARAKPKPRNAARRKTKR